MGRRSSVPQFSSVFVFDLCRRDVVKIEEKREKDRGNDDEKRKKTGAICEAIVSSNTEHEEQEEEEKRDMMIKKQKERIKKKQKGKQTDCAIRKMPIFPPHTDYSCQAEED
ncbi:Protein CBG25650 [Caenorhabditis briggsae]|uniref:Protein CBG25650 n=1 Tax=Caenorhabditis briggsae TaxID=6238 RepID=B6IFD4_CAEBR|nr:Protein CBG25650 [Caenorhabditis briggsae]CAR98614.1 Protein CBG25650 [Caenorhabditis briggsae]